MELKDKKKPGYATPDYYLDLPKTPRNAHKAITWAIRTGFLIRPDNCQDCGRKPLPGYDGRSSIQGHHHKGYEYPFDVKWLCPECHASYDPRASGKRNGWYRHSDEEVREIVQAFEGGEAQRSIARRLNISQATVWRYRKGIRSFKKPRRT